jgi:hypothetical protein
MKPLWLTKLWDQELGYLALAITQAGAYIHTHECTLEDYLAMYRDNKLLLEEYRPKLDDYAWTVYTTWHTSYNQLTLHTAEFLRLLSFMHHDGISEAVFRNACHQLAIYDPSPISTDEDSKTQGAITQFLKGFCTPNGQFDRHSYLKSTSELQSYSLIDYNLINQAYSIHPLLQDWVRHIAADVDNTTRRCTAFLLALAAHGSSGSQPQDFQISLLVPHLDAILADNFEISPRVATDFAQVYREVDRLDEANKLYLLD